MITESLNLHRNSEAALTLVDADAVIDKNEINTKIKITYDEALQEIFGLANEVQYKKYFYKILNEQEVEGCPRLLGAAVDKTLGDVFVIVKNQSNSKTSLLKKTLNGNWQFDTTSLEDKGTYLFQKFQLVQRRFEYGIAHFFLASFYEDKNNRNQVEPENAASYLDLGKKFCPINQPEITEKLITAIEYKFLVECYTFSLKCLPKTWSHWYNFSPNCYTINYQDIANKFQYNKMKNARNYARNF